MNFFNSLAHAGLESSIITNKADFVSKFGNYNENFTQLDTYGKMKLMVPFIVFFVLSIILLILFFKLSYSGTFSPTTSKIMYYIAWFFVVVAIIILGYGSYLYLFVYLGQYSEWFKSLPIEGQREINIINSLTTINDNLKSDRNVYRNRR